MSVGHWDFATSFYPRGIVHRWIRNDRKLADEVGARRAQMEWRLTQVHPAAQLRGGNHAPRGPQLGGILPATVTLCLLLR